MKLSMGHGDDRVGCGVVGGKKIRNADCAPSREERHSTFNFNQQTST